MRSFLYSFRRLFVTSGVTSLLLASTAIQAQTPAPDDTGRMRPSDVRRPRTNICTTNCIYTVSVTPDNGTTYVRSLNTVGYTEAFTIQNTGNQQDNYSLTCSTTGNLTCTGISANNIPLAPGSSYTGLTVTYSTGAIGSGTLTLTAQSAFKSTTHDNGSYGVTIRYPGPIIALTPYNFDNQDYGRCANACFAFRMAQNTVPYVSLGASRSVTLAFNSDRIDPQPYIHTDVTHQSFDSQTPLRFWLEARINGAYVTWLNGETKLRFNAASTGTWRLGGQFNATSYATGVYPLVIIVTTEFATEIRQTIVSTKLTVVNENTSPIARGWTLAGIQRLYAQVDGSVLITDGEGSAVYFGKDAQGNFVHPSGDFSKLVPGTPSGGTGWTRRLPDSTKVVFNAIGRMIEVRDRFNNISTLVYDVNNRLSQLKDPLNATIVLAYNANGLSTITDPGNRVTTITVQANKTLTVIRDPDNISSSIGYDAALRLVSFTNRRGTTTTHSYDPQSGRLSSITGSEPAPIWWTPT